MNTTNKNELLSEYIKKRILLSVDDFFDFIESTVDFTERNNKKIEYLNIPCSFDIETSSFYSDSGKVSIMYEWTFSIYAWVVVGRTWEEFMSFYDRLVKTYLLSEEKRLIVYVHNLAFEFQYMRKRFSWLKIFAMDKRKPIVAVTTEGVEFRCSYKLSGYSLAKLSDQLTKYSIKKLEGDLDYYKTRHSLTPLTAEEMCYCINDCLVVNAYIQELIESCGDITRIPLTKTGFVRKYCRDACYKNKKSKYNDKFLHYRDLMKYLELDPDTYIQLKRAFAGGFTHASPLYAFDTVENVKSYDFTSSYPFVMVSEKFPMSPAVKRKIDSKDVLTKYLENYCCLFDVEFFDLEPRVYYENYISVSHCYQLKDVEANNGRIVRAGHCLLTVTDIDFKIIKKFYKWKSCKIFNFNTFERGYLPKDFVKSILDLYVKKTTLKDVDGKEAEYLRSKEDINSAYGMCVTDICREEISYNDGEWSSSFPQIDEVIEKNNRSMKRFLYYPWGVWVTAYARYNLFTGIREFREDYLYSDTDSIKVINYQKHQRYIEKYNEFAIKKLQAAMSFHNLDMEMTAPKNAKGETKQLGIWSDEGVYTRFKSLGAKRYLTEKYNEKSRRLDLSMTVSGINKKVCVPYLIMKYGQNECFSIFTQDLHIPAECYVRDMNGNEILVRPTGKLTHTYIDEEQHGTVKDYLGTICRYDELSSIHMEPASYDFSITEEYIRFVEGIKEIMI